MMSKIVKAMLEKGILLSEDALELGDKLKTLNCPSQLLFMNKDVAGLLDKNITDVNWLEL